MATTRKYDCTTFVSHTHETAIIEVDDEQTHVTIYNASGRIVNMWNCDTTDVSDVVNSLNGLYLRITIYNASGRIVNVWNTDVSDVVNGLNGL